tara:strand:+ start:350 stop:745 length:396 start_codon:yes stop_codon:yes gene_type:complete
MAVSYKVRYRNHCTPQEKISLTSGSRWYLDSDCGRKLTGNATTSLTEAPSYFTDVAVTTTPSLAMTSSHDFIYIKNTGGGSGSDVLISLDGTNYFILLSSGESFASEIHTAATIKVKCSSGDSTIEYVRGT